MGLCSCSHFYDQRDTKLMIITSKNSPSSQLIPLGLDMIEALRGLMVLKDTRWSFSVPIEHQCREPRPDGSSWVCSLPVFHPGMHFAFTVSALEGMGARIRTDKGYAWAPGDLESFQILDGGDIIYDG